MIELAWFDALDAERQAAVEDMLALAVEYDAEAGFSTARPSAPGVGSVRHLVVTIAPVGQRGSGALDALPDVPLVAYLRLDLVDGVGDVQLVVRPEFRSHGIATLMAELLAGPDGWSALPGLREVRSWSHGAHPAAERMARRFGARVEHGVFKTLRLLGGSRPYRAERAEVRLDPAPGRPPVLVPGHEDAMAPHELAVLRAASELLSVGGVPGAVRLGVGATVPVTAGLAVEDPRVSRDALRVLLGQGLIEAQARGARVAQLFVDALVDDFVAVSRELGFEHDQSDHLYALAV
ncbi:GNAT family N-acetyltransferase [Nocardioides daeguensis]|uniref:N-acetyltransferase domain-containing protein n=1 Tax=Nocardioides daeguensis TaxID=908359 RepID=A0ABP6V852_9ACTN|nr:GNAT family N-acetyltransferase [Nocardioides daeguensis]MBV6726518.1 GNAT family N-acetyltransferase [Nocardioides daeguensis]MCR1772361.1 GNAT family N-acetyltransferase [Nocardioides daeguensis]